MSLFGSMMGIGGMVIGGAIGGIITGGNPAGIMIGASIGGSIGGLTGAALFPDKIDPNKPPPPQPHESRIQFSTFGAAIPIVYESARLAGNIIYMQSVQRETDRSKHRQDGVRYYEYIITYRSTFAIAFCEGPVEGVCRIWVNGSVFADFRDPSGPYYPTGSVGLAAGNLATSIDRQAVYFTIYTGTETQTADPSLVAILGAAETPSYRGICYIVFKDFPVGEFTGIPKIEVEIGPQMDTCSEYFEGTDGAAPSTSVLVVDDEDGTTGVIESNKLYFEMIPPSHYGGAYEGFHALYDTTFSFLGEFDIYITWDAAGIDLVNMDDGPTGIYLIGDGVGSYPQVGIEWWKGDPAPYFATYGNVTGAAGGYQDGEYYYTTVGTVSGKLRLTRDASWDIRAFVWNSSLSQWEWNGSTSGFLIDHNEGYLTPGFAIYTYDNDQTVNIDDFVTVSGCDNTQPVGS